MLLVQTSFADGKSCFVMEAAYLDMFGALKQPLVQLPCVFPVALADLKVNVRLQDHRTNDEFAALLYLLHILIPASTQCNTAHLKSSPKSGSC